MGCAAVYVFVVLPTIVMAQDAAAVLNPCLVAALGVL